VPIQVIGGYSSSSGSGSSSSGYSPSTIITCQPTTYTAWALENEVMEALQSGESSVRIQQLR
jgi:hypothetical protein